MNLPLFLARKFHFEEDANNPERLVSRPSVNIATAGVAIGLAVMIIALAVTEGFKSEIRDKISGFGSHIQITDYNNNDTYETNPVRFAPELTEQIKSLDGVRSASYFCTKPGILKTDDDFKGVVLKGVDCSYDWEFFERSLTEGALPRISADSMSNEVLASAKTTREMRIAPGDKILVYFISENVRVRRFTVAGIYETGLQQFDDLFLLCDLKQLQRLGSWQADQFSGLEVKLEDFSQLQKVGDEIFMLAANRFDEDGSSYDVRDIRTQNRAFFAWLDLIDMNVIVIIALMTVVVSFNIISCLLILILGKTRAIGMLKALGARNSAIRKTMLCQACFIIIKGLLIGNLIGIGLCLLQHFLHVIPLDPEVYFVSYVPVRIAPLHLLLTNLFAAICQIAVLVLPSQAVARISPAETMRFE